MVVVLRTAVGGRLLRRGFRVKVQTWDSDVGHDQLHPPQGSLRLRLGDSECIP